ncbi:basic proline-rich protein-like [Herpailurus yagouaroundi]|uniref:basic proline-rich protein-like n=1 Tax=Herpailurus yagouaroundi TaxID=1608482 RepID=UPI001AD6C1D9|nr:basic proline-rich protein-like [Puma yagouaroundi]
MVLPWRPARAPILSEQGRRRSGRRPHGARKAREGSTLATASRRAETAPADGSATSPAPHPSGERGPPRHTHANGGQPAPTGVPRQAARGPGGAPPGSSRPTPATPTPGLPARPHRRPSRGAARTRPRPAPPRPAPPGPLRGLREAGPAGVRLAIPPPRRPSRFHNGSASTVGRWPPPPPAPPPEAGPVPRSFSTQPRPSGWPATAPGPTCLRVAPTEPPLRSAAPPRVSGLSTSPQEADGEREASAQSAPPACGTPSYQRGTQARLRPPCPMPVGPRRLPGYPPPLWTSTAGRGRRDPGYQPNPRGGRGSDSLEEHTLWPADDRRGRADGSPLTLAYCPCCLTLRAGHLLHPATPPEVTP